jgi:hypothetical protein
MRDCKSAAKKLRELADDLEAAQAEMIQPVDAGISIPNAAKKLRDASGGKYICIKMELTVHTDGRAVPNWATYIDDSDWSTGFPTLAAAINSRLAGMVDEPVDAIQAVESTMVASEAPF